MTITTIGYFSTEGNKTVVCIITTQQFVVHTTNDDITTFFYCCNTFDRDSTMFSIKEGLHIDGVIKKNTVILPRF